MQDELESTELEEWSFSLACASRGFHEYGKMWAPRINKTLSVEQEKKIYTTHMQLVYIPKSEERSLLCPW